MWSRNFPLFGNLKLPQGFSGVRVVQSLYASCIVLRKTDVFYDDEFLVKDKSKFKDKLFFTEYQHINKVVNHFV
jgi:hypothetical protein